MQIDKANSTELNAILGKNFPVLDQGYIRVIDYLGDDSAIVQAARTSCGKGTKQVNEDRDLIRYLMRHDHTTPFEMCVIKFHVKVPMDCWRQWIRHRTACLAEGTEVYFDLPGGIKRRGNQLVKRKIEDIYNRFQPTVNQIPRKQRDPYYKKKQLMKMNVRQLDENSMKIGHTNIVDVFKNGKKPVYKMCLEDGKTIECTNDHRFLFKDGWKTLKEATGLNWSPNEKVLCWNSGDYYVHVNGNDAWDNSLHQNKDWLNYQYNVLKKSLQEISDEANISTHTIRKWLKKYCIQHEKGGRLGNIPWNTGKKYNNNRVVTEEQKERIRLARSGEKSNFWKGGMSSERESVGRWTTQIANKIHKKNQWTCQLCEQRDVKGLHCHHIVPVLADESLAREESNLTTLCIPCHKKIHGKELDYVKQLSGKEVKKEWVKKSRIAPNKFTIGKLVKIEKFEYVGEKETYDIEVVGPSHNFIANGIITHNSVNECSSRYSLIDEMGTLETPEDKWRTQSKNNKQGSGEFFSIEDGKIFTEQETEMRELTLKHYKDRTDKGMAREQARKDLVLSTYTEAYWKIDLKNLLNFLKLRMHPHAQLEIRTYANTMAEIIKKWVPITWEAFEDYCLDSVKFSKKEIELLSLKDGYGRVCKAKSFGWIDENYNPSSNEKIPNFCLERKEFEQKTQEVFGKEFDVWHNFLNCF